MRLAERLVFSSQIAREYRAARERGHGIVTRNPIGVSEMALMLLGAGVIGTGIYLVAKKPATAAKATTLAPITGVVRPSLPGSAGGGSFNPIVGIPPGPYYVVSNAIQVTATVPVNQAITLALPPGATWVGIVMGNKTTNTGAQIALGTDLQSPVSVSNATIKAANANLLMAAWLAAGVTVTSYAYYTVTAQ
jgi:hypothetical protein